MTPIFRVVAYGAIAFALCVSLSHAADKRQVVLGTATPGGGFPVYGAAFAATVNEAEPALEVVTKNTRGSAENIPLLEARQIDIGLVQGESVHEAINGIGRARADL